MSLLFLKETVLLHIFLFTFQSGYIRESVIYSERPDMLVDHAQPIKGLRGKSKRGKKIFIQYLVFALAALFLLSFYGFIFNSSREHNDLEYPSQLSSVPERVVPAIQNLPEMPAIKEPVIEKKVLSVSSGDTLIEMLPEAGVDRVEAHRVITALKEVFNPKQLRRGQEINIFHEISDKGDSQFHSLNIRLDVTREVMVTSDPEKGFVSKEIFYKLEPRHVRASAEISTSLYNAAIDAGMPLDVLIQMIRAYSYDVDFQRDIRPNDAFEALYEEMLDENGNFVRGGSILYASLQTRGKTLTIYRYETSDGEVDLFDEKGQSVRKTLMVTPIDGARLSSGYGMRRHPILGYSRMHKGLDFAAPKGTPIMASGDGMIEYAGRKGGYGNYIRIRHANEYQTVYGHLSKYAKGIRKGVRVKQGETIGYVGSTGVSTGPHLHYEVLHRGKSLNPVSVKTPPGRALTGEELELFLSAKKDLETST